MGTRRVFSIGAPWVNCTNSIKSPQLINCRYNVGLIQLLRRVWSWDASTYKLLGLTTFGLVVKFLFSKNRQNVNKKEDKLCLTPQLASVSCIISLNMRCQVWFLKSIRQNWRVQVSYVYFYLYIVICSA